MDGCLGNYSKFCLGGLIIIFIVLFCEYEWDIMPANSDGALYSQETTGYR